MSTLIPTLNTGYWHELKRAWLATPFLLMDRAEMLYTLYYSWSDGTIEIMEMEPLIPGQAIPVPRGTRVIYSGD